MQISPGPRLVFLAGFLAGFLSLASLCVHAAEPRSGTLRKVLDGDTVELISGERVRLLGIDAPESNTRNRKIPPQPFHGKARDALAALVARKRVLLIESVALTDRWGRTLAYLQLPDGTDVQLEMLRSGHAMMTAYPPDLGHLETYREAEAEARRKGVGMWSDPFFEVQPLEQGVPKNDGPVRVSGVITSVSLTGKHIEIVLSERLTLRIWHAVWKRFWGGAEAQNWVGKRALAQGRINSESARMGITHPQMLEVGWAP